MSSVAECAKHLDLSERRFRELLDSGVFKRKPAAQYNLTTVRTVYIRWLRKQAAGRAGEDSSLTDERTGLLRARREQAERRNALAAGEAVLVADVESLIESDYTILREHLLGIAGKIADGIANGVAGLIGGLSPQVVGEIRILVEGLVRDAIHEALSELSSGEAIAERATTAEG
jgi:terminase small subunit / prophage DNA-packing protein